MPSSSSRGSGRSPRRATIRRGAPERGQRRDLGDLSAECRDPVVGHWDARDHCDLRAQQRPARTETGRERSSSSRGSRATGAISPRPAFAAMPGWETIRSGAPRPPTPTWVHAPGRARPSRRGADLSVAIGGTEISTTWSSAVVRATAAAAGSGLTSTMRSGSAGSSSSFRRRCPRSGPGTGAVVAAPCRRRTSSRDPATTAARHDRERGVHRIGHGAVDVTRWSRPSVAHYRAGRRADVGAAMFSRAGRRRSGRNDGHHSDHRAVLGHRRP